MGERFVWHQELLDSLRSLRAEGVSIHLCAELLGVHSRLVHRQCKALGINQRMNAGCIPGTTIVTRTQRTPP
jgi:hypothetical protein